MSEHRAERLASVMQAELANLIMKEIDVPPGTLLSVTSIEISPDAKNAKVWVSIFPESQTDSLLKALKESAGNLHYKLIRIMNIRTVPILNFLHDTGADNASAIEKVFIEETGGKVTKGKVAKKG